MFVDFAMEVIVKLMENIRGLTLEPKRRVWYEALLTNPCTYAERELPQDTRGHALAIVFGSGAFVASLLRDKTISPTTKGCLLKCFQGLLVWTYHGSCNVVMKSCHVL